MKQRKTFQNLMMSNSHNNRQLTNQERGSQAYPPRPQIQKQQRKFDYKIKLYGNIPLCGNTFHVKRQKYNK